MSKSKSSKHFRILTAHGGPRCPLGSGGFQFFLALLGVASVAQGDIIRVPADQPTIQAAIDVALTGDTVLLAPGIYTGDGNKDLDFLGKSLTVRSEKGPEATVIDCEGEGRGFYLYGLLTKDAIVEGLTVRNGNVEGDPVGGGAIFIAAGGPQILNCRFEGNRADGLLQNGGGGAISVYQGAPTISNCSFVHNRASGSATIGGALAVHHSSIRITSCTFQQNQVTLTSGGGGGIGIVMAVVDTSEFTSVIQDCVFTGNQAGLGGGAFLVRSLVERCRFDENQAGEGGGLCAISSEINDCSAVRNTGSRFAGGIDVGTSRVNRCVFIENTSADGGGVRDSGYQSVLNHCLIARNYATRGGGYLGVGRAARLINCTLADNEAMVASGAYLFSFERETWSFENTIISGGRPGSAIHCERQAMATLSCSNVFDNAGGDWAGCIMGQEDSYGNLSANPGFCQSGSDWYLCSDSPCAPEQSGKCGLIGALPVGCDKCGVSALQPSTWGQIKFHAPQLTTTTRKGKN